MDNRPIGVFDSGVGGLTVVNEIQKIMPHESIVYAGDTARVPYGGKSPETLLRYGQEIIHFLSSRHQVKAVVIACGTISSNVFKELREDFPDLPLVDVIEPGVQATAEANPSKVGFIATEATIRSGMFTRLLKENIPGIHVEARACPLFVPMVEEGWVNNVVTHLVAETYLEDLIGQELDALVLGCTHYPLLTNVLRDVLGDLRLINMAEYTARALSEVLDARDAQRFEDKTQHRFYVSGYSDKFDKMARMILGKECEAEMVDWK